MEEHEHICEYCQLPITHNRVDIAYINNKLVLFHPISCKEFLDGTKCVIEYFSGKERTIDLLSADLLSTTMEDLEQTPEEKFIQLLQESTT